MIFDDNDCPVEPGVVGQIVCRPKFPNVMFEGYWNRPEATALAWRNLWMHTGDLGRLDEQGWLYFVDRSKDYLRSKGENVSSFEVESVFMAHGEIVEAAVHAVSGRNAEDEIKLTAVLKVGSAILHRELCLWAIGKLPYFAVPRYFEFRHELPRNPTGKVLKYKLRDEGVTAATWDREEGGVTVHRRM
jgi:crotonobetaine/carnitine-CoA ligase